MINQEEKIYFFKRKLNGEVVDCDCRSAISIFKDREWRLNFEYLGWSDGNVLRETTQKIRIVYSEKTGMAKQIPNKTKKLLETAFNEEIKIAIANPDKSFPIEKSELSREGTKSKIDVSQFLGR